MATRLSRELIPRPLFVALRTIHQNRAAYFRRRRYVSAERQRKSRFESTAFSFGDHADVIESLERDGHAVLRGVLEPDVLHRMRDELHAAIAAGQVESVVRPFPEAGMSDHLTEEEVARGEEYIGSQANITYVRDVLINCPTLSDVALSDIVIDIAAGFYGCPGLLTSLYLMKNFANGLPISGFNHFHCDYQADRFIKFFAYLNDVDKDGGPFCYVRGSHRHKPRVWRRKYFWDEDDIEKFYGRDAIEYLTANVGDLIVADVTGFHRAFKARHTSRHMMMVNTGLHEFTTDIRTTPMRLSPEKYRALSPKQRAFAELVQSA